MMEAAKDMANHSQQSASHIIDKTDAWSEATAKRLEGLLANIENRTQDFTEASTALLEAKTFMSNLLSNNATALAQMAEASRNVQAYSSGLVGQSDALRAISSDQAKVANHLQLTASGIKASLEVAGEAARGIPQNDRRIQIGCRYVCMNRSPGSCRLPVMVSGTTTRALR